MKSHLPGPITPREILTDVFVFSAKNADIACHLLANRVILTFSPKSEALFTPLCFSFPGHLIGNTAIFMDTLSEARQTFLKNGYKKDIKKAQLEMATFAEKILAFKNTHGKKCIVPLVGI
jgi:hypothetical protein